MVDMSTPTIVPAGWYQDPYAPGQQRYFDGRAWTPQVQPRPADVGPNSAMHYLLPVGRSWQSVVAPWIGVFGALIWILAPFSVALGIWGLVVARRGGHGTGRSILAIVLGVIGTLLLVGVGIPLVLQS